MIRKTFHPTIKKRKEKKCARKKQKKCDRGMEGKRERRRQISFAEGCPVCKSRRRQPSTRAPTHQARQVGLLRSPNAGDVAAPPHARDGLEERRLRCLFAPVTRVYPAGYAARIHKLVSRSKPAGVARRRLHRRRRHWGPGTPRGRPRRTRPRADVLRVFLYRLKIEERVLGERPSRFDTSGWLRTGTALDTRMCAGDGR